jgi:hypothetical protein
MSPDISSEDKLQAIRQIVEKERKRRGVTTTPGAHPEGSCFAARGGEFGNMFNSQLVYSADGTGEWPLLEDDEAILDGVYEYAVGLEERRKRGKSEKS